MAHECSVPTVSAPSRSLNTGMPCHSALSVSYRLRMSTGASGSESEMRERLNSPRSDDLCVVDEVVAE